jgi:hypothetical protein
VHLELIIKPRQPKCLSSRHSKSTAEWAIPHIFRLRNWTLGHTKGNRAYRPQIVANYTKDLVYARLAPGILRELEARNPIDEHGHRKAKHHQWLTEDVGHPALAQHLHAVIGLMRAANSWDDFKNMLDEIAADDRNGTLYLSNRLSTIGRRDYPDLLREAAEKYDVDCSLINCA